MSSEYISAFTLMEEHSRYTLYLAWIRNMDKLVEKNSQSFQCIVENKVSKTFTIPRNFISIQSKECTVTLTEKQKKGNKVFAWYGISRF